MTTVHLDRWPLSAPFSGRVTSLYATLLCVFARGPMKPIGPYATQNRARSVKRDGINRGAKP